MVKAQQATLAVEQNGDRVETKLPWTGSLGVFAEESRSQAPDLTPLTFVQRIPWRRKVLRSTRLDLNEYERRIEVHYQVDLAEARAVVTND